MNVAKWLLSGLLALPLMELVAFIVVAALIGFGWALVLILAGSAVGFLILRHAGGNHIERVRVRRMAMEEMLPHSGAGIALSVLSCWRGILLLVPGFITDLLALLLLVSPLQQLAATGFDAFATPRDRNDVVDLAPEQWHQVPDPSLPDQRRQREPALRYRAEMLAAAQPNGVALRKSYAMQNNTVLVPIWTVC